ncbi:MAG TPA: YncE family protein [Bryobacteraceae bacterium]|nr:YncE family protein [Bryobacteraceae bacterium]
MADLTRRSFLLGPAVLAGCAPKRATGFRGYCLVADQDGRAVTAVDLTTFRVRRRIPLDAAPSLIVSHPSKPKAFVLAPDAGTVYEIDLVSFGVSRRVRAGSSAIALAIAPRKDHPERADSLWVLYRDPAALIELRLDTFRPGRTIRFPSPPDVLDLSVDNRAAVAFKRDHAIALASLDHAAVERTFSTESAPAFVLFRSDGETLVVGNEGRRSLTIYDVATGKTVVRLALAIEPQHFAVSPDGGQVFLSGDGMDAVAILFPYDTEIWQTVLAGHAPGAMAAVANNLTNPPSLLYVLAANPDANRITVLNGETLTLAALVQVGRAPRQILITPDQKWALVVNGASGDLAVIRILSLNAAQSERVLHYKTAPLFTMIPVGEKPVSAAVVGW